MVKRFGILAAVALTFGLAACTSPTAPAAPQQSHVGNAPMSSASGVLIGSDT